MGSIVNFPEQVDWFQIFGMLCNMPEGWEEAVDGIKEIKIRMSRYNEPTMTIVLLDGSEMEFGDTGDKPEDFVDVFKGMLK